MKLWFIPLRFLITPVFIAAVDVVLLFPMVLSLIDVGRHPARVDTLRAGRDYLPRSP